MSFCIHSLKFKGTCLKVKITYSVKLIFGATWCFNGNIDYRYTSDTIYMHKNTRNSDGDTFDSISILIYEAHLEIRKLRS